ncbi:MAG: hypothetical protein ABI609_17765 [Acidobacteriota bacterium]
MKKPAGDSRRAMLEVVAVALGFLALTLFDLRPIGRLFATHLAPDDGDPLLVVYILEWVKRQIVLGLPDLWNANFFFPSHGVLALSDHLLAPAAQALLLSPFLSTPVAGYNALLIFAFVGSGTATFWVARQCGCGRWAALIAAAIFTFSPFRWHHLNHLQVLTAQWVPLTLWLGHRLLAAPTVRHATPFLAAYLLNLSSGCYIAYMIHLPLGVLLVAHAMRDGRALLSWRALRTLLPVAAIAGISGAALFMPYARAARAMELERQPTEIVEFGASLSSYLSPAAGAGWLPFPVRDGNGGHPTPFTRMENRLYAGAVATLLLLVGACAWSWRQRIGSRWQVLREADLWWLALIVWTLLSVVLSFPAGYLAVMRWIPGLSAMRVPTRFYVFTSLGIALLAGRAAQSLIVLLHRVAAQRLLFALVLVLTTWELTPDRFHFAPVPPPAALPPVYTWIAQAPEVGALLELPVRADVREARAMYASTVHWKPIANGYSGFLPAPFRELVEGIPGLPDGKGFELLRHMGVSHLLVHAWDRRLRVARDGQTVVAWRLEHEGLDMVLAHEDGADLVFQVLPGLRRVPAADRRSDRRGARGRSTTG